jgi:hypothetical protein
MLAQDKLVSLLRQIGGPAALSVADKIEGCGQVIELYCPQDGVFRTTRRRCRSIFHYDCGTDTTTQLALMPFVDLAAPQRYRRVWLHSYIPLGGGDWEPVFRRALDRFNQVVARLSRRKAWAGKLQYRAYCFFLGYPSSQVKWKIMLVESRPGECDELVRALEEGLEATICADEGIQSGEEAQQQAMQDSRGVLLGIHPGTDSEDVSELFRAFWGSARHRHGFQSMSVLARRIEAVMDADCACVENAQRNESEKRSYRRCCWRKLPCCPVCGRRLQVRPAQPREAPEGLERYALQL